MYHIAEQSERVKAKSRCDTVSGDQGSKSFYWLHISCFVLLKVEEVGVVFVM